MKYYIIAGEASGDLHAGNLIRNIKKEDPNAVIKGFGGDKMIDAGAEITVHYNKMAYMGFLEVLINYHHIRNNFKTCFADILDFKPDTIILVDYAGFNLRVANFAKAHGFKVQFYISPKVWAWKKSRVKKIKKYIDRLYLILPFEKEWFKLKGYDKTDYVGNPLTDAISTFKKEKSVSRKDFEASYNLDSRPIIALLAGSRKQEVKLLLPDMLAVIKNYPDYQFVIAGAPSLDKEVYQSIIKGFDVKLIMNQTYQLLNQAHSAIVTSGTATLETALFRVPQVVMYRFNHLSYALVRPFIWLKVKYFSLVNLIMDKEIVREYLQYNLTSKVKGELDRILFDSNYRDKMLNNYDALIKEVGAPGTSERTAKLMVNFINENK